MHTATSSSGRKELIVKEKKKRSAKKRTVLDDRFNRTYHAFTRAAGSGGHLPDTCNHEATRRFSAGPQAGRVGCYAELGSLVT